MRYGRLEWPTPDELSTEQRKVYDLIVGGPRSGDSQTVPVTDNEGRLYGPFTAMLSRPRIAEIVQMLGVVIRYELELTPRSREIATLAVASATRSRFEWYAHARLGSAAGLTDTEIQALAAGQPAPTFSAEEHLIWRVVSALIGDGDLDDDQFAEARQAVGEAGLVDLIALVGLYEFLARSLRVWRTPVPGDEQPR